jgi:general secretion pathway protein G
VVEWIVDPAATLIGFPPSSGETLMEQGMAQAIDPARKRKQWIWILAGLGAVVIACLAVLPMLAARIDTAVVQARAMAARTNAQLDIQAIDSALEDFAVANGGKFPDSLETLVRPDVNGKSFLDRTRVPLDPWGHEFIYEPPGPGNPGPIVRSYGKDGQPGGEGDDADVDNLSLRKR